MRVPWNRGGLRSWLILLALLSRHITPRSIALGIPFLCAAIALHVWTKGCLRQRREVSTAGPYRFVRHPFYAANACLDLGIAIMSGWWLPLLVLPLWWIAVYRPIMRSEEATMARLFGAAYGAYRERVPAIVPHRRPLPAQPGGFSWSNPNLSRSELPRALRGLSYPLLLAIASRLHAVGLALLHAPSRLDAFAIAAWLALNVASRVLRHHFAPRKPAPVLPR